MKTGRALAAAMAGLLVAQGALGDELWNEPTQGDLSGDRFNPSAFTRGEGVYSLVGTTVENDLDYFSITLAPGMQLTQIVLIMYDGQDGVAFIAVQNGAVFTEPPEAPNAANLLGWAHFGTFAGNVGADILPEIGLGFGAIGFTPPLPTSTYCFWVQQVGDPTLYQMDFVIEPAPAPCYANCDGSTAEPILNVNDFTCFLNTYAAGHSAANCDASTAAPVLNVNDFLCFLNTYAAGCR